MRTTISSRGFARRKLDRAMRVNAKHIFGRLRRYIAHAELALKREDDEAVSGVHVCTLRLRMYDAADVVVLTRGRGRRAALAVAFRRARHEMLWRRRRAARQLPVDYKKTNALYPVVE